MALVATNDTTSTPFNTPVTVPVLANDTLDGTAVQLADLSGVPTITVAPTHGATMVEANGSVTYTPTTGFSGADSFSYQIQTAGDTTLPEPLGTALLEYSCGTEFPVLSLEDTDAAPYGLRAEDSFTVILGGVTYTGTPNVNGTGWDVAPGMPSNMDGAVVQVGGRAWTQPFAIKRGSC